MSRTTSHSGMTLQEWLNRLYGSKRDPNPKVLPCNKTGTENFTQIVSVPSDRVLSCNSASFTRIPNKMSAEVENIKQTDVTL